MDEECALWAKRGTVLPDVATEIKSFLKRAQRRTRGTVVYRNVQGCNEPMVAHGCKCSLKEMDLFKLLKTKICRMSTHFV